MKPFVTIYPAGIELRAQQGFAGGVTGLLRILDTKGLGTLDSGLKAALEGLGSAGIGSTGKGLSGIGVKAPEKKTPPPGEVRVKSRAMPEYGIPGWHGRPVLGPGGACPTVPRKGGHQDVASLLALLKKLAAQAEQCDSAFLTARQDIPWAELAPTLSVLSLQAGYDGTVLAAGFDDLDEPVCEEGVPPEAIVNP